MLMQTDQSEKRTFELRIIIISCIMLLVNTYTTGVYNYSIYVPLIRGDYNCM